MRIQHLIATLVLVGIGAHALPANAQTISVSRFDTVATARYIERGMRDWKVPGLAIAIVRNDSILFMRGFGVSDASKREPVTHNTVFAVGSTTKAFTAAAVGMALQHAKLGWNAPVSRIMPSFRVRDSITTRLLTVADLLGGRGGGPFPNDELGLWYDQPISRDSVIRRLATVRTYPLRQNFVYPGAMYSVAGELIPQLVGMSYEAFLRDSLFRPLGMTRTNLSVSLLPAMNDVASPYQRIGDSVRLVPYRNLDNIAAAGAINSSVRDMAQWVRFQLGNGRLDGRRIVDSSIVLDTRAPLMVVPNTGFWKVTHAGVDLSTWGMGWAIANYHEKRIVEHTGSIDGMYALVGLIPDQRLGVVILTNLQFPDNRLPLALRYWIYDAFLGVPQRDWNAEYLRGMTR